LHVHANAYTVFRELNFFAVNNRSQSYFSKTLQRNQRFCSHKSLLVFVKILCDARNTAKELKIF